MTKEQEKEVRQYLEMKGISSDCIDGAVKSIRFHDATKALRDDKDVKRGRDIMKFKPNPGKATLTQVGETQTYLGGDNHGLPIYQEDVDMIKKALPLAKRLIELQKLNPHQEPVEQKPLSEMTAQEKMDYWDVKEEKEKQTLRTLRDTIDEVYEIDPEELNMGPDTTENINEVRVDDIPEQYEKFVQEWDEIEKYHATPREQWEEKLKDVVPEMVKQEFWEEFCRKNKAPEVVIDDLMYPSKEAVDKAMEECNKNVSQPMNKDLPFPGYIDAGPYSYGDILSNMEETHRRKNSDYGDAAYQGYKKFGDYYFLVQLHNKLSRLESLTIGNKKQQVKEESIDDTLLDMANYAVMYLESRHRDD